MHNEATRRMGIPDAQPSEKNAREFDAHKRKNLEGGVRFFVRWHVSTILECL